MTIVPVPFEIVSLVVIVLVLVVDIVLAYRWPRVPSTRESAIWVGFYVALALVFAAVLLPIAGADRATEFVAGWLTEYSLSIDNLFVFLVIGAQLIASFSWIFYLFGAFLIYTAIRQAFASDHGDAQDSRLIRFVKRHLKVADHYDGGHLRTTVNGRRMWTPIVIVLVAIGSTDVLFALDSIPAIFGITDSSFIVFTTNVFALMGLRQLYFLLGDLVERLKYLKYGIGFILAFIGVKLILHALHENELPFINGGPQGVNVRRRLQPSRWASRAIHSASARYSAACFASDPISRARSSE
jgi:tellurite resistance protein TerC